MRREIFQTFDNSEIVLYVADETEAPFACLQLAHGMAEHARRYEHFASFMNKHGIIVAADDHRAFGHSVPESENGVYDGDVFGDTLHDLVDIHKMCRKRWPGLPMFFLGHSYGSLLGQGFIQEAGNSLSGAVLMGSSYMNSGLYTVMQHLIRPFKSMMGFQRPAKLLDRMIFGSYDRQFKEGPCAWLSRDRAEVEKYLADPLCGKTCSLGFYESFMGFRRLYKEEGLEKIPKSLPLLLISGADDPVGGGRGECRGMKKLYDFYRSIGLEEVRLKLYPGARHELLNETNRQDVYEDLLAFFMQALKEA